ncbi:GmrSD restriction endonuclease domain-containing protein [Corynebacterium epidermidicanis]|nr:DUF262 domain-containing protein [Corynebacterium epidermidicanis]
MYSVNQETVSTILSWIDSDEIAIPEMQRPFVWTSIKVRDLMDSLYRGYPVGYLITWKSQTVPVKGGGHAGFQQILIDGQQRTTALRAALAGEPVMGKDFKRKRIIISFNPQTEEFETATPFIRKQPAWIYDIHEVVSKANSFELTTEYLQKNPDADIKQVAEAIQKLIDIPKAPIGIISLSSDLDVETVTEIFVRINSKGVPLSSADFVMSKISAYGEQGRNLRKLIDYFAYLAVSPHDFDELLNDDEFTSTPHWQAISWLKSDTEDLYDPSYVDLIRVASMLAFRRGRISFVVRELSGLNPETREFEPERIQPAYDKFEEALLRTVSEYEFKKFLVILKSTGFIRPNMISSINAVNFAYALFLIMREQKRPDPEISSVVRRWFVMIALTGRSSGSFETAFERDLRGVDSVGAEATLKEIEEAELGESFWEVGLPQRLASSSIGNPQFRTFLASQVKSKARAFLSKHAEVSSMIETQGDIHHMVPKEYLRQNGVNDKRDYNQVGNFVYAETAVNIRIGKREPAEYLAEVLSQIKSGVPSLGEVTSQEELERNFDENAVPWSLLETTVDNYEDFLRERRTLIAAKLRVYYRGL